MLHLSPANGWPFKTPRCHFRALQNAFFFILVDGEDSYKNLHACLRTAVQIPVREMIFVGSISRDSICLNF